MLFQNGKAYSFGPIRMLYLLAAQEEAMPTTYKVGFAVPKKTVKLAVTRNLVKRRMRAAFHTCTMEGKTGIEKQNLLLFFIFRGKKEDQHFTAIFEGVNNCLARLQNKLIHDVGNE